MKNYIIQKANLNSQINIAMGKVASNKLRASLLTSNFNEKIKNFISSDRAFTFMNGVKRNPAFSKTFCI